MTVLINGERRVVESAETVDDLVVRLFPEAAPVLVEHNDVALRRTEWRERRLADGDRIEIIRIVAGG